MAEQLKKVRNRTPEQEALLREVRHYQARMKMRICINNQARAMIRQGLVTEDEGDALAADLVKPMEKVENHIIHQAAKHLKDVPIWEEWLQHVRGIGSNLAVQFVALIQPIADFPNVAKLWAYAGYAVKDGEAVRRRTGQQSRWNPDLKRLGFQAGDCFIRAGGPYRELYDRYKARETERHPEPVDKLDAKGKLVKGLSGETIKLYTKGHLHNRARRYAIKIFLSHLWQAWRELEGLPCPGPYAIEILGHTTIMSPWEFVQREEEPSIV